MSSDPRKDAGIAPRRALALLTSVEGRWRLARAALWILVPILAIAAAWQFYRLRHVRWIELPVSAERWVLASGDVVRGTVTEKLPEWRLRWDGQWPLALLCNKGTGEVIGPSLLRADSLDNNSRGVRWSRDGCEWVIDRATWNELGSSGLEIRCQRPRWRVPLFIYASATMIAALGAIFCGQRLRVLCAAEHQKRDVIATEMRRSLFIALSLLMAAAFFPGFVLTCPGDVANINSFAAALDTPAAFERDALLADPRNFAWYTPLYVKFVRLCGALGFHYNSSRAPLALVATAAGLFGYFRLFRTVSRSGGYALAAALGLWFHSGMYPSKESWAPELILPRTVFAGLLPWALLAALRFQRRPKQWSISAAISALLFYVHPVSAPALLGAQLTGFVAGSRRWTASRIGWGIVAGLAAVAVMVPYSLIYAGKYVGTITDDGAILKESFKIARRSFGEGVLSPSVVASDILNFLRTEYRFWPALVGLVWLIACRRRSRAVRLLVGMSLGYAIVTLALPTVDLMLAARRNQLPFQVDLFRNLRYLDVWMLLVVGVSLRELTRSWRRSDIAVRVQQYGLWSVAARPATAGVLLALVSYGSPAMGSIGKLSMAAKTNFSFMRGHHSNEIEALRVLLTLRQPHEVVNGPIALRQWKIPVAFTPKDRGALIYSNPQRLIDWQEAMDRCKPHVRAPIDSNDVDVMADVLGADLSLISRKSVDPTMVNDAKFVFRNSAWVLVRHDRPQPAGATSVAESSDNRRKPR